VATRPNVAPVPTAQELGTARTAGYQAPAVRDLEIAPAAVNQFADRTIGALRRDRFSERQAAQTYDLVNSLRNPEFGATHRLADFDSTRQRLNAVAAAPGTEGEAARRAIRAIDAFTLRVPQSAVLSGDARAAGQALFEARANAAAQFRSERIQQAIERATNTAGATHSGGNLDNEIRKQFRTMLNNPRQMRGFSAEEREAMRAVANGGPITNLVRRAGKLLGGGGGLGQLLSGGAGAWALGWPGAIALPAAGMLANRAGIAMTANRARLADELVRSRSPLYGPANQAARQQALAGGLLAGLPQPQQLALQAFLAR
jgi:hypothetical protein